MYLTGGQYKGFKIITPKDVKPTLSKIRESVFNILNSHFNGNIDNKEFLDMFSGSAIMGLEALSRGYKTVQIEKNPQTAKIIKENYKKLKTECELIICDAFKLKSSKKFDVIYADPPWESDYEPIFDFAAKYMANNGILISEYDKKRKPNLPEIIDVSKQRRLVLFKEKAYGRCCLAFYSYEAF